MPQISEEWLAKIKSSGYSLTQSRRAVVTIISGSGRALTPAEVCEAARQAYPALGLVSVYRTLEKLEQLGLVQRVHQTRGCQAFTPVAEGHQHLLICSRCGKVVQFEGDQLEALFSTVTDRTGYRIDRHWLQASGLCYSCQHPDE